MTPNVGNTIIISLNEGFRAAAAFIPSLVAGIIIFLIGILLASIVKRIVDELLRAVKLDEFLAKYGVPQRKEFSWSNFLAEAIRWFVIILFSWSCVQAGEACVCYSVCVRAMRGVHSEMHYGTRLHRKSVKRCFLPSKGCELRLAKFRNPRE